MKLLLDENLSHRLVPALQDAFANTVHVQELGLQGEPDAAIWTHAGREGYWYPRMTTSARSAC